MISFEKVLFIMGAAFLLATPLLLLFKTGRVSGGGRRGSLVPRPPRGRALY